MSRYFYSVVLAIFLLASGILRAETLILRNGTAVRGNIVSQNEKEVTLKTSGGQTITFGKYQILKIVTKDNVEIKDLRKIKTEEESKLIEEEKKNSPEPSEESGKELSRSGIIWRSALLPGWGQYKEDRKFAALVFPALILISGAITYQKNLEYRKSIQDADRLNSPYGPAVLRIATNPVALYIYNLPFEAQRHAIDRNYREVQIYGALTVFLYLLNIADAAFFYKSPSAISRGLILDVTPGSMIYTSGSRSSEVTLGYYFRF